MRDFKMKILNCIILAITFTCFAAGEYCFFGNEEEAARVHSDSVKNVSKLQNLTDHLRLRLMLPQMKLAGVFNDLFSNLSKVVQIGGNEGNGESVEGERVGGRKCKVMVYSNPFPTVLQEYIDKVVALHCEANVIVKNAPLRPNYEMDVEEGTKYKYEKAFEKYEKFKNSSANDDELSYFRERWQLAAKQTKAEQCSIRALHMGTVSLYVAKAKLCHELITKDRSRFVAYQRIKQSKPDHSLILQQLEMEMLRAKLSFLESDSIREKYKKDTAVLREEEEMAVDVAVTLETIIHTLHSLQSEAIELYWHNNCSFILDNLLHSTASSFLKVEIMLHKISTIPVPFEGLAFDGEVD